MAIVYKLCLIQNTASKYWGWHLQPIEPHDWPFDPDRAEFSGIHRNIRGAMRMAHELVPKKQVEYIYMDRKTQLRLSR
jgi:hypothetical protein